MSNLLMMYLAEAVVERAEERRPGARHAMLIFVSSSETTQFDRLAIEAAEKRGWVLVDLQKSKELDTDIELIEDNVLRDAAQEAADRGSAVVIYKDEIVSDA